MRTKVYCVVTVLLLLTGCKTLRNVPPTPVEPHWVNLTTKPVLEYFPSNHTYRVTGELVERAAQMEEFMTRYRKWKNENGVP